MRKVGRTLKKLAMRIVAWCLRVWRRKAVRKVKHDLCIHAQSGLHELPATVPVLLTLSETRPGLLENTEELLGRTATVIGNGSGTRFRVTLPYGTPYNAEFDRQINDVRPALVYDVRELNK